MQFSNANALTNRKCYWGLAYLPSQGLRGYGGNGTRPQDQQGAGLGCQVVDHYTWEEILKRNSTIAFSPIQVNIFRLFLKN